MDTSDSDALINFSGGGYNEVSCSFSLVESASTDPLGQWIIFDSDDDGCVPSGAQFTGNSSSFFVEFDFSDSYLKTNSYCIENGITGNLLLPLHSYIFDNNTVWAYKSNFIAGMSYPTLMSASLYNKTTVFDISLVSANISDDTFGDPSLGLWVDSPNNNAAACCLPVKMTASYTGKGTWNAVLEYDSSDFDNNDYCLTAGIQGNLTGTIYQITNNSWILEQQDESVYITLNMTSPADTKMTVTYNSNNQEPLCSFELDKSNYQPTPSNPKGYPRSSLSIYIVLSLLLSCLFL